MVLAGLHLIASNLHAGATPNVLLLFADDQRADATDRWKLIIYPQADCRQLFDLQNDPNEAQNLINDPNLAAELIAANAECAEWSGENGEAVRAAETTMRAKGKAPSVAVCGLNVANLVVLWRDSGGYCAIRDLGFGSRERLGGNTLGKLSPHGSLGGAGTKEEAKEKMPGFH